MDPGSASMPTGIAARRLLMDTFSKASRGVQIECVDCEVSALVKSKHGYLEV